MKLFYSVLEPQEASRLEKNQATRWMYFLHGIMGKGSNFRSFASEWLQKKRGWGVVLVDLPFHGKSQVEENVSDDEVAKYANLLGCAQAVRELSLRISKNIHGLIGHSFGGKVALKLVQNTSIENESVDAGQKKTGQNLEEIWIIDSCPGIQPAPVSPESRRKDSPANILHLLEAAPKNFSTRAAFVAYLTDSGCTRGVSEWLAMNLVHKGSEASSFQFGLDVSVLKKMLWDHFSQDLWFLFEEIKWRSPHFLTPINMVLGGKSKVFSAEEIRRLEHAAQRFPEFVRKETIEGAGHWVHVDARESLLDLLCDPSKR